MKILIIEDAIETREMLMTFFEDDYDIIETDTGKKGLEYCEKYKPEIVILDIGLPDINGMLVCDYIKGDDAKYGDPKIVMLTGETEQKSVIKGLKKGVRDYIKKPFDIEEVKLRIDNIADEVKIESVLAYQNIKVDETRKKILQDNEEMKRISVLQYNLISFLIRNKGIYVSREKIYETVWGTMYDEESKALDQCIKKVKNRFPSIKENLETKVGFGYRLKD